MVWTKCKHQTRSICTSKQSKQIWDDGCRTGRYLSRNCLEIWLAAKQEQLLKSTCLTARKARSSHSGSCPDSKSCCIWFSRLFYHDLKDSQFRATWHLLWEAWANSQGWMGASLRCELTKKWTNMSSQKPEALGSALGDAAALNRSGERGCKSFRWSTALAEGAPYRGRQLGLLFEAPPMREGWLCRERTRQQGKIGNLAVQSFHHSYGGVMCTFTLLPKQQLPSWIGLWRWRAWGLYYRAETPHSSVRNAAWPLF